jgi:hypothetical protein
MFSYVLILLYVHLGTLCHIPSFRGESCDRIMVLYYAFLDSTPEDKKF